MNTVDLLVEKLLTVDDTPISVEKTGILVDLIIGVPFSTMLSVEEYNIVDSRPVELYLMVLVSILFVNCEELNTVDSDSDVVKYFDNDVKSVGNDVKSVGTNDVTSVGNGVMSDGFDEVDDV